MRVKSVCARRHAFVCAAGRTSVSEVQHEQSENLKSQKSSPSRASEQADRNGGLGKNIVHGRVLEPRHGAHDAAPGPVTVGELPVPHHFRPLKLDSAG